MTLLSKNQLTVTGNYVKKGYSAEYRAKNPSYLIRTHACALPTAHRSVRRPPQYSRHHGIRSYVRTYGALHSIPATTGLSERRALRRTLESVFVYSWGKGVTQATYPPGVAEPSPVGWDGRPPPHAPFPWESVSSYFVLLKPLNLKKPGWGGGLPKYVHPPAHKGQKKGSLPPPPEHAADAGASPAKCVACKRRDGGRGGISTSALGTFFCPSLCHHCATKCELPADKWAKRRCSQFLY